MTIANKIASVRKCPNLPLALLLIALSTVFLFGGERHRFYRSGSNVLTANYMAVAMNLSPEHNFVGHYYRTLNPEGDVVYFPYNRFPPGGYALIKLATLPFGGNLSASLYVGRLLMLTFFIAAALFAYLALSRIAANRWIALTATLLTFSSYYCLFHNDTVATDAMPDLFGVMLTFHGIVIFAQEGRFRQLVVKACIALLLGWHVYALLLTFIVIGLGRELIKLSTRRPRGSIYSYMTLPFRSRYMLLGGVSLLGGVGILAFNFTNEYFAMNGETPLMELRSVKSTIRRTGLGLNDTYDKGILEWQPFLKEQIYRGVIASMPYAFAESEYGKALSKFEQTPWVLLATVMGAGALLIDLKRFRHKALLAALSLFGFCWALLARQQVALHDFEGIYYIGIPLVLFTLLLLFIHKRLGGRLVVALAITALPLFGLSAYQMSLVGNDAETAEFQNAIFNEFQAIRDKMPQDKVVYIPIRPSWQADTVFAGTTRASIFYLSGRVIVHTKNPELCRLADFVITAQREEGTALLTPNNRLRFLYERSPELTHISHIPEVCQWKDG